MNPWSRIERHARNRRRAWRAGRITLVLLSVAVLVAAGLAYWR
jgi:hypothetical protein